MSRLSRSAAQPDFFQTLLSAAAVLSPLVPSGASVPIASTSEDLRKRLRTFEAKLATFATFFDDESHDDDDVYVPGRSENNAEEQSNPETTMKEDVAMRALWLLEQIQAGLVLELSRSSSAASTATERRGGKGKEVEQRKPLELGAKDMQYVRALLVLTFYGLAGRLSDRCRKGFLPATTGPPSPSTSPSTLRFYPPQDPLIRMLFRIYNLIYESSTTDQPKVSQTYLTASLLGRHATSLLAPSVMLGWVQGDSFPGEGPQGIEDQARICALTQRLLQTIPISQGLASLGAIMASSFGGRPAADYVKIACKSLMSAQVMRPGGAQALMDIVFGDDSMDGEVPLHKLEKVAATLSSVPSNMSLEEYYQTMIPRLLDILSPPATPADQQPAPSVPPSHLKAAAFSLARMLRVNRNASLRLIAPSVHSPFIPSELKTPPPVYTAIALLTGLMTNSDPSPMIFHALISPILPPLWSLYEFLQDSKVADPIMKEQVEGLIRGWARLVGKEDAVRAWWNTILSYRGWGYDIGRSWIWAMRADGPVMQHESPTLDLETTFDVLRLNPDPAKLVDMLKAVNRKEVSVELFVHCLDRYGTLHADDGDPTEAMLFLQMIIQMADAMGPTILEKPEHVLSFIVHALESSVKPVVKDRGPLQDAQSTSSPFRIVPEENDSDDEDEDTFDIDKDEERDEFVATALTLLLSVLEANDTFPTSAVPLLNTIYGYLDPLINHPSETLNALAREARLVLMARRASAMKTDRRPIDEIAQARQKALDTYQEALRLIQDPILPVRAHGLMLLRQLLSQNPTNGKASSLDPALIPAILDVFLQAVQDDESYVYLNAVKGLAAMVNGLGAPIFRGLVALYVKDVDVRMSHAEMDKRVRIGEALAQAIQQCGEMLIQYVDIIIPPIYGLLSAPRYPTVLRSSALSILAQCGSTYVLALLPWYKDLASALVDLMQLETVSSQSSTVRDKEPSDEKPTSIDAKMPMFRRSAAYLLTALIREAKEKGMDVFDQDFVARTAKVLRYVRSTDADYMVRIKAGETLDILNLAVRSKLGLD